MADLADILAGAFGGFANPNDPFGYARIQLGRQQELDSALDANARTKILQGELDLRRQMQPISIAQVQADIERLGAERKKTEAATAAQEEATKEAQYQWDKSGRPLTDFLGSIWGKFGGHASAAMAAMATDPLAQLKLGYGDNAPADIQGMGQIGAPRGAFAGFTTPNMGVDLNALLSQQAHRKAVAGILGAKIVHDYARGGGEPPTSEDASVFGGPSGPPTSLADLTDRLSGPAILTRLGLGAAGVAKAVGKKVWNGLQWVDSAEMLGEDYLSKLLFGSGPGPTGTQAEIERLKAQLMQPEPYSTNALNPFLIDAQFNPDALNAIINGPLKQYPPPADQP